jgi:hypothetical protein
MYEKLVGAMLGAKPWPSGRGHHHFLCRFVRQVQCVGRLRDWILNKDEVRRIRRR